MLKAFRDNSKNLSWILWAIIALFILFVFVDFGGGLSQGGPQAGGNVAASVGDQTVTMEEFERQYRQTEDQYRQMYGEQFSPELAKQIRLPLQVIDRLVTQKILLAEAERLGLQASDEEVQEAILAEQPFKDPQGKFIGPQAYENLLRANNYTVASFEQQVRNQLMLEKLNNLLLANAYISEDEIRDAYREQVERAKIRYVQVAGAGAAADPQVTPAEVQSYFDSRKEQYRIPEQREGAYLLVETEKLQSQVQVPEQELKAWYNEHIAEFSQEEQVRARHILAMVNDQQTDEAAKQKVEAALRRVQGGEDFAKVAAEVSEDPGSKTKGGDLGFFKREAMVKEFSDAAFGAQPGQLVGPVKSSFGYHIIEVTARQPGGRQPFEQVREQIRVRLGAERVQSLAETKAKQIATQLAGDKPKDAAALQAVAQKNPGTTFAETGKFGRQEPISGIGFSPALTTAAFGLEKGAVSEAVQVPRGWAIFYLKEVHEPRVPELKDVEPRVRMALVQQKRQTAAMDRLKAARGAGKPLDQVAAELGVPAQETPEFGAQGAIQGIGINPELAKAALSMRPGQIGGPIATQQGAILFQVTERKQMDPKQFATAKEETRERLRQEKLGRLLASLIEKRRRDLGVEYDRQLLESFGLTEAAAQPT
ncbi:MAG TPA: peptidyl-prolyl cis-trans isomerase [Thermoanaerobaculia bacterium]|nr:peptidyl-prolyl cis-trans isomerase [Thermoanaerobaculia bacterium]